MRLARSWGVGLVLVAVAVGGCGRTVLAIGSPFDRYDHNRTRPLQGAGPAGTIRLTDEMLAVTGSAVFPRLHMAGGSSADSLPAANLVPVFTGVALPLSAAPVPGARSDHDDLVDFLGAGPNAHAGVEPGDMAGAIAAVTARCYADVLTLLSSPAGLGAGAKGVRAWAACCDVTFADEVVDPRYRSGAFDEVTAFRYRQFWFVLYRLPDAAAFSRLVVAPVPITRQDFGQKAVGGC